MPNQGNWDSAPDDVQIEKEAPGLSIFSNWSDVLSDPLPIGEEQCDKMNCSSLELTTGKKE